MVTKEQETSKKRSVPNKRTFKVCSPSAIQATVDLVSYAKNRL